MLKRYLLYGGALLLLLTGCQKKETPVKKIVVTPEVVKLFVGETQEIQVECYPSSATNLDQLTVANSNPEVADFENGKLLAKSPGNAQLLARCGNVSAKSVITVYAGWFSKRDKRFGVDIASGYNLLMGEATPQAIQIELTHQVDAENQEHFWLWMLCSDFGKTIDFSGVVGETMVAVYLNNNEDGYTLYGGSEPGCSLRSADWVTDVSDISLVKGTLKVEHPETNRYKIQADFQLSNGFTFSADWDGYPAMTTE